MKIDIDKMTSVLIKFLIELNIKNYKIDKHMHYTSILINNTKSRRIMIYDDTICIVYGKNLFGNEKYDLIDWIDNKNELISLLQYYCLKRYGNYANTNRV